MQSSNMSRIRGIIEYMPFNPINVPKFLAM